jgi:acyl dehydratase
MSEATGLIRAGITDEQLELMRKRIGYPNPTLRVGILKEPWNIAATADSIRRFALCVGDDNPLYTDPAYAAKTRWGETIAPPGFEKSMGLDRSARMDPDFAKETSKALRGVQLYYSGGENFYYAPIVEGTKLYRSKWVSDVQDKVSEFAQRSAVVTNGLALWDDNDRVYVDGVDWYVHAERKKVSSGHKYVADKPALYTDEEIQEIEAAYDAEFRRGAETLYFEDVEVGEKLPRMVKGPFSVTDLINLHMGAGWLIYGNPPYRLAYENRKAIRGFYSRNEFNSWDTVQRVHWDTGLAKEVGVQMMYDIGAVRQLYIHNYVTNWAGDDAWVHRIRFDLRRFNYMGDVTWINGSVSEKRIDERLGPVVELEMSGVNQRGGENVRASATVLLASRELGPVKLPTPPPPPKYRSLNDA